MTDKEYCYSLDGEYYHGREDDPDVAFQVAIDDNDSAPGDTIFIGQVVPYTIASFAPNGVSFTDSLAERAFDFVGEHADDWLEKLPADVVADLESRIKAALTEWADTNNQQPRFYGVEAVEERAVPALGVTGKKEDTE